MTRSEERTQFLADVITIALEGGVGYWSEAHEYRWNCLLPGDTRAVIRDIVE